MVEGSDHTLTLNIANSNGTDGFTVHALESRFERNTASYNGRAESGHPADGYGIRDTTTGSGTGGTDNTYLEVTSALATAWATRRPPGCATDDAEILILSLTGAPRSSRRLDATATW